MMILIRYHNGEFARVPTNQLENLIRDGQISHFRRSGGWVAVAHDPLRKRVAPFFHGHEQRYGWRTHLD